MPRKKKVTPDKMTNSELNIKMEELSNEYETVKAHIVEHVARLEELDKEYDTCRQELTKRGIWKTKL